MTTRRVFLRAFGPTFAPVRRLDVARGTIGALLGIAAAAVVVRAGSFGPEALPFIVAPIGASAVLVFAAPASPLAQPWPVLVGNTSSAAVGIVVARLIDDTLTAAAVAVSVAIGVMMLLRALHPPGGACALYAAVGSAAVREQGLTFAVWPVGANTLMLLGVAVAVNHLTGRQYPHIADLSHQPDQELPPSERAGVGPADVERAMARLDQGLDIMPADVLALVHTAEEEALDRHLGRLRCDAIMTHEFVVLRASDRINTARLLIAEHHVEALAVVDDAHRVVGIVTLFDLFDTSGLQTPGDAPVTVVMSAPVTTVAVDTPAARLVALMSDGGLHDVPVVDAGARLVGMVTRRELIAILHRALDGVEIDDLR